MRLGCNITNCSIKQELTQGSAFTVTVKILDYNWKFVSRDSLIFKYDEDNLGNYRLSLRKAKSVCSKLGMTLFTVRSRREAEKIGQYLRYLRSFMRFVPDLITEDHLQLIIGLTREREKVGQRFRWGNGKDLLFSYWADNEPKGGDNVGCAVWKINKYDWEDQGWSSASCGEESTGEVIFCHSELPSERAILPIRSDHSLDVSEFRKKIRVGKIYVTNSKEMYILTSMSLAVSTGFIHHLIQNQPMVRIEGLVQDEVFTVSNTINNDLFHSSSPLFFRCGLIDGIYGVPHSQVCDGKEDCSFDEAFCDETAYPSCSTTEFTCTSKQCVPLKAECDLVRDCQDGSDEVNCDFECHHKTCDSGRCLPKTWFHDGQVDCADGSDEPERYRRSKACIFICNRTQCVTKEMLNNSILDCKGPEGPLDETLGSLTSLKCTNNDERRAFLNNWAPKCVLIYDNLGEIIGCRDFQHLEDCEKFVCPVGYAKCPGSFCIPIAYINDGKQDCNEGQDESPQPKENFSNYFKCHPWRNQWVPLSSLCDGRRDCSQGEDELDCEIACASGFICLAGSVFAFKHNKTLPTHDLSFINPNTKYLDLSGIKLPNFFNIYPKGNLTKLLVLRVSNCGIKNVPRYIKVSRTSKSKKKQSCKHPKAVKDFGTVQKLDLSHNEISSVAKCSFIKIMPGLKNLDLSHNYKLTFLSKTAFADLRKLRYLDLSFTGITTLGKRTLINLINLDTLSIKHTRLNAIDFILPYNLRNLNVEENDIQKVEVGAFTRATSIKELRSPNYKLCCPIVLGSAVPSHNWGIYSSSGMCLGLPLSRERLPGWQYSVTVFIGMNCVFFLLIGVGQFAIYRKLKQKGEHTRKIMNSSSQLLKNQRLQEFTVAKQLSLVVMSNFICWFPIITMGLMTFSGKDLGEAAYRWSAGLLLPINSALNPLLYTVPTLKDSWQKFREARKCSKAMAQTKQTTNISQSGDLRQSCQNHLKTLASLRKAVVKKSHPSLLAIPNLEMLCAKVTDLQEACKSIRHTSDNV
ncbi:low-density lipoprotein receptor-related protein [Plakobranchus ocellatus]|uniref:Low-density lipoprotein receptor-related protein n=1 Tax=Plakobranchus ocellatus TaxID=259542 RepID=A0AAV4ABC7_9GAST|nr:low-density lipoprotein receptor-related protein [Plakobranchus ocellatus]